MLYIKLHSVDASGIHNVIIPAENIQEIMIYNGQDHRIKSIVSLQDNTNYLVTNDTMEIFNQLMYNV